jgi:hypothetical protein
MQDQENATLASHKRVPWNKGKAFCLRHDLRANASRLYLRAVESPSFTARFFSLGA